MASIKKIAEEMNWDLQKKAAYGTYTGYNISLIQNVSYANAQDNYKLLYVPYNRITDYMGEQLHSFIQANKKALRVVIHEIKSDILIIRLNEGLKGINKDRLMETLDLLLPELSKLGFVPKDTCAYCSEEITNTTTYINQVQLPAHDTCKQEAIVNNQQLRQKANGSPNEITAYVGATIGAILGAIPYAIAVWFGWYVGILSMLTALASYQGFKMFGGSATKPTKYIVAFVSLVAILLSNVALMQVIAIANAVTLSQVLSVPEIQDIFFESLGMSALFGLLGVMFAFRRIKNDEFNTIIE